MLIYSENRYISTETNMMIIRAKDNIGYYYIHRGLYDQAVILYDKYSDDYLDLCEVITGNRETRSDVDTFVNELPTPINILGCFLLLVQSPLEELLDMVGAIHVMSNSINFRRLVTVPAEMRASVEFSLTIKEEYELPWDRFIKESIPWSEDFYIKREVAPMGGTVNNYQVDDLPLSNIGDDGVEYDDPLSALVFGAADDIFDMPEEEMEDEDEEDEEEPVVPKSASAPLSVAPVTHEEPVTIQNTVVDQPKVRDGMSFLRGLAHK